jgi:hypothetical protein
VGVGPIVAVAATGLVLAGCGDQSPTPGESTVRTASPTMSAGPEGTTPTVETNPTTPTSQPTSQPTITDGQEDVVITFEVEGGYTAQQRSLRLGRRGAAVAEVSGRSWTGTLPPEEIDAIVAELEASGLFEDGAGHTFAPSAGADLQRYQIGFNGASVTAYDTTVPTTLTRAVQLLQAALRSLQR